MVNIKKIAIIIVFFANFILLGFLGIITKQNLSNFSFDKSVATSLSIKTYLVLLIIFGQIFLIIKLTKIKFIRNITNYKIASGYYAVGPFLVHIQHHPSCSCFKNHELIIKKQRICSGCYGSSLGILIGIIILFFSSFLPIPFDIYFYSGVLLIQLALLKTWFDSYLRFILNSFFPLGINLLLTGSLNLPYGLIYVLLIIPILLLEFALRLFIPGLDRIPEICPEGLIH